MKLRFLFAFVALALMLGCGSQPAAPPDTSTPPEPSAGVQEPLGAGPATIRTNQIRTRHLFDGSVTAGKIAFKTVAVSVTNGTAAATTAVDATIAGGVLVGCTPTGNQDQFIDNVVLNANGSITVTLAANATATNTFNCVAVKPNGQGIS